MVSHHYCHSVPHSDHSMWPSVCVGSRRLAADSLTVAAYTQAHFVSLSQPSTLVVYAEGICSLHHCAPSPPFLPVQTYWSWPEAVGCLLFHFSSVTMLGPPVKEIIPEAAVKSSETL